MDRLYRLLFAILLCFCFSLAHKSRHDEYVSSKNITATVSPQIYLNHPFEMTQRRLLKRRKKKHGGREPQEHKGAAPRRGNWEPLRIHVDSSDFDKHTFGFAGKATLKKIQTTILPLAIKVLSKHLHVIPVNSNLKVTPMCHWIMNGEPCCGKYSQCKWSSPNKCADVAVPDSHHTVGIPSADFVVYLTANEENNHDNALAVAATCIRDQHDRPTAAEVQLNLEAWESRFAQNYMVAVLVHELSHALGWSAQSFNKFRDENGNVRVNPVTTKTALGKKISLLSTPAVASHVRSHFGCKTLTGMELEDQGGSATAGSHPEKRIFTESYMAGVTTLTDTSFIIDAMALSVFQDSGWYQVKNLDQAGKLSFGRGMGCRVPTHKCNDWGAEANARGMFCTQNRKSLCLGNQMQVRSGCSIAQYSGKLPSIFQYFSDPTSGGDTQIADFCPRVQEYNNGDCSDTQFSHYNHDFAQGTQVGSESRCFMSLLLARGYTMSGGQAGPQARCFLRTCNSDSLEIHVNDQTVSCPVSNRSTSVTVNGYTGYMVCPPYSGLADIRCSPRCSTNDPECLGPKGSAANFTGSIDPAAGGTVVVHGR